MSSTKTIQYTYEFRLYPNENQIHQLPKSFGSIVKVNKYYPSSKICHICGYKKTDLTLSDREWICPICHTTHNRDYNAAMNILKEGLKHSLSLGTNDYADKAVSESSIRLMVAHSFSK